MDLCSAAPPCPPSRVEYALGTQRPRKRLQKPCLKLPKQLLLQPRTASTASTGDYTRHKAARSTSISSTNTSKSTNTGTSTGTSTSTSTRTRTRTRTSSSTTTTRAKLSTSKLEGQSQAQPQPADLVMPRLPLPDLTDSRWAEYVQDVQIKPSPPPRPRRQPKEPIIIPEFARLAVSKSRQRLGPNDTDSPSSPSGEWVKLRRQAKTPVFRVGQLEGAADMLGLHKRPSLECKMLELERPSRPFPGSGPRSAPLPVRDYSGETTPPLLPPRRWRSSGDFPSPDSVPSVASVPSLDVERLSPTSDDGTLVSFDEQAIYFKPTSFDSGLPPSPTAKLHGYMSAPGDAPPTPGTSSPTPTDLGLQICLDLLTRELASAMHGRHKNRSSHAEVSHLQIWVMIEAYERLREQLLVESCVMMPPEQRTCVEDMINTWLRALYAIHNSWTMDGANTSVGDVDALPKEDVD